jgi:hypothetical protein
VPLLEGVVIEFEYGWYDGPTSGVAEYRDQRYWFEADEDFYQRSSRRELFLYQLSTDDLAEERRLHHLWEEQANGKPVDEWPAKLVERDMDEPTKYAKGRTPFGWFSWGG